jgi:putative ABC transport system permease protein
MIQHYFKQAWNLMKQNRFYTAVYILGTGLAVSLVMVIAIIYHIRTADIAPEVNRGRTLYCGGISAMKKDGKGQSNSLLSYQTLKECFYSLETAECATGFVPPDNIGYPAGNIFVALPGVTDKLQVAMEATDAAFWRVFQYSFINGSAYSEEEFQSGYRKAVICESLAYKVFATREAVGQTLLINDMEYVVGGVVKDVSTIFANTYAEVWIPFSALPVLMEGDNNVEDIVGWMCAYILARSPADFPAIRAELEQKRLAFNTTKVDWELVLKDDRPYTQRIAMLKSLDSQSAPGNVMMRYALIMLIFLLVPAVNLSGLTSSRMQEQVAELGVRKAFGARQTTLFYQVMTENLVLTLLGGALGLLVSYLLVLSFGSTLLRGAYGMLDARFTPGMLLNLPVFFYALLVCVVLNLLSSLIPVWSAARQPIVTSINDK